MATTVLLVEDDAAICEMLRPPLRKAGFDVLEAGEVGQARTIVLEQPPDLILLDWMLPDVSGIDWARTLKQEPLTKEIPIIMLTARGEEEDRVKGLDVGADDYVTKPFSPRELVARMKAVLRRTTPHASEEAVEVEGLRLDPVSHRVTGHGQPIRIGPTEYNLLLFLITHPDRVFTRGQLLDRVWGTNVYIEERTVDAHIRRLRKTLEPTGHDHLVQTVRGAGYRFSTEL